MAHQVPGGSMDILPTNTVATIGCCLCGASIPPNPANMCVTCLRTKVDISEGVCKSSFIFWCKGCERYLAPPDRWVFAELESRELLALCLRSLKGLSKVKLVDAGFIWTEPHSKRLRVQLTIQKEVFNGAILQQTFEVVYVVQNQFCNDCHAMEAEQSWTTSVQVRQKVAHKRTFLQLEQLILKHKIHLNTVGIKEYPDGLDFYYKTQSAGTKLVEFLSARVPVRTTMAKKLISQDDSNNTYKYKFTVAVEIVPICRDDLVALPRKTAARHGNITPLVLCSKVASVLHIVDPLTAQHEEITSVAFWKTPFRSLATRSDLTEFIVLDIEPLDYSEAEAGSKFSLADAQVSRISDFGVNDITFNVTTHLGHLLQAGDHVLGYDLVNSNFNDVNFDKLDASSLPEIVLVRKSYRHTRRKRKRRTWKLQELAKISYHEEPNTAGKRKSAAASRRLRTEAEQAERDREVFLRDIEEDPELRAEINLYRADDYAEILRERELRASGAAPMDPADDDDDDASDELEDIPIEDLLDPMEAVTIDDPTADPDPDAPPGRHSVDIVPVAGPSDEPSVLF
ncbi:histone acetyltransferase GCN5 [Thecamonas trahens ATCC 50062]|uniref:60S ribosomal export protein NMD3 n=1 Tax=Thecamonas trahens ATCC 50062 TaxID=461836 RepID=A0A0L0D663_THETB|nr:histone acetyltransferase GCN5 [Thecamonas trahens ATCC 50062]KNC47844.1 histone acetyltransferase GCN5 [Thecamonas trahens ATCC 50062]|eukprot:XP_013759322.1 histone acetyltransferase GCN5 [Thecamonas trahens ATCC 50062]